MHSLTTKALRASIDLPTTNGVSFWDSLTMQSANHLGATVVWSEELNHGQRYGVTTVRNQFHLSR